MKKDEEWVTGVTPNEGDLTRYGGSKGVWPRRLLSMKVGEWVRTPSIGTGEAVQSAAAKAKKQGKGVWITRRSTDGKWRWIQRVK